MTRITLATPEQARRIRRRTALRLWARTPSLADTLALGMAAAALIVAMFR